MKRTAKDCITASRAGIFPAAETRATRTPIKPVSGKRAKENRQRSAMADRLWPDRREGTVMCGCGRPECHRPATDLHEPLSRARGGSITDEANAIPLSRNCHDEITFSPESELGWAYEAGILVHSWTVAEVKPQVLSDELIGASIAAITPEDAADLLGSLKTGVKR
jgi:hypothetical protein